MRHERKALEVFPKAFDYFAPRSLAEALSLVERYGDDARLLAGGQSVIPLMKLRFLDPAYLIDLKWVPDLKGIELRDREICCGAMTRHCDMERSKDISRNIPLLHQAATEIADVQVRNRGTLGGALCQADPAGDWAVTALALGARMRCTSQSGDRVISAGAFFKDTFTPAIDSREILVDVRFPIPPAGSKGVYIKIRKRAGDFAIASAAVQITCDANGRCANVGVGLGGVGSTPVLPNQVVDYLTGRTLTAKAIEQACDLLEKQIDPIEDIRGSVAYKRRLARVVLERALHQIMNNYGTHS